MAIKAENVTINGTKLYGVHPASICAMRVEPCVIHRPSDHHMRKWPIVLCSSRLIERTCEHGVDHPDPDSLAFFERRGRPELAVHGCDGCCMPPKDPQTSSADRIINRFRESIYRYPYSSYVTMRNAESLIRMLTRIVQKERETDTSYVQLSRTLALKEALALKEQALIEAKKQAERYRLALADANNLTAAEKCELADLRKMMQQLSGLTLLLLRGESAGSRL